MLPLHVFTVFIVLVMIGSELFVSLFLHPIAHRLPPQPQEELLSLSAAILGRYMPIWYAACFLLLCVETWLHRHTAAFALLAAASALWLLVILATVTLLVPINNRIAQHTSQDWRRDHRTWDNLHHARILLLAVAAVLLAYVLLR